MTIDESTAAPAPAPAPAASRDTGPAGRVLLWVGLGLAALAALWGALFVVDLTMTRTETTHETYSSVGTVELIADGHVTVVAAEGDIEVDRVARRSLVSPEFRADERSDRLVLTHECRWWLSWQCSGSFEVTVPADTEVVVRTTNGRIEATGLARDLDVASSNGRVEATGIDGDVVARSSNGDVTVRVAGGEVEATSSNGDIEVVDAGGVVVARSNNGDVAVRDADGDVEALTDNGRIEVDGVTGDIRAESSNGDVTVYGPDEPVALTISTSNGHQVIEGPTDPDASRTVRVMSSNGDVSYLAGD
ncbi:DUF4097 family beta strand repeat-containing protein [Antribacter gilvus]|uniref:DUF4097 family beta strand repeat-containing protein n=1 Tax=Antribacter gilvus TaxID=2304675 RepID=UPI000F7867C8|nr:DUF4097 family beta strand repeat-containing protein [Antribacter gilvus]